MTCCINCKEQRLIETESGHTRCHTTCKKYIDERNRFNEGKRKHMLEMQGECMMADSTKSRTAKFYRKHPQGGR